MTITPDARNSPRKTLRCHAKLTVPGAGQLNVRTADISMDGLCVFVSEQLRVGQACLIAFDVTTVTGKVRSLNLATRVIYSILSGTDGFRTGLQFTKPDAETQKMLAELIGC